MSSEASRGRKRDADRDSRSGLSVWQIHLGFDIWQWNPPAYASYIIYGWAALMFVLYVVGFVFIKKELRQNRAEGEKENVSDEHLTARNSP